MDPFYDPDVQATLKLAFNAGHYEANRQMLNRLIRHHPDSPLTGALVEALPRHPYMAEPRMAEVEEVLRDFNPEYMEARERSRQRQEQDEESGA